LLDFVKRFFLLDMDRVCEWGWLLLLLSDLLFFLLGIVIKMKTFSICYRLMKYRSVAFWSVCSIFFASFIYSVLNRAILFCNFCSSSSDYFLAILAVYKDYEDWIMELPRGGKLGGI